MIGIVGGSGFIGTRLAERLESSGREFRIIDKNLSAKFPAKTFLADVRERDKLKTALAGCTVVVNLAAEHKDNVTPKSLYHEVNVFGSENIASVCTELGILRIVFTSSVAIYGFAPPNTDENGRFSPFNEYGVTKLAAEKVLDAWLESDMRNSLAVVRPTVVFGERNRGNVYNLLRQVASGFFVMVGPGRNLKSMAYVGNLVEFLIAMINASERKLVFNYVDKPDLTMNQLVPAVRGILGKNNSGFLRIPYWLGMCGGIALDIVSFVLRKKFPVSAIRVKKFCATTQFASAARTYPGFVAPYTLEEAIEKTVRFEFIEDHSSEGTFESE